MKKSYFLLSLAALLVVTGCNNNPNNPSDSQNTNTEGTSNDIVSNLEGTISDWSQQDKTDMQNAIGMVLPVAPLTNAYQNASYEEDDGSFTFYVNDETIGDQSSVYGAMLTAAGFTAGVSDSTYGYDMHFYYKDNGDNSYAYVQLDYYPGDDEYSACFEIFAFTYVETPTIDVEPMAWSEQDKTDMQNAIGMLLPEAPLTSAYQNMSYEDETDGSFTFYVYDETVGDQTSVYGDILEEAGFTYDSSDNTYGYDMYFYYLDNDDGSSAYIQLDYYPGDDEYSACFEIYAWTYYDGSAVYTEWPSAAIASLVNDSSVTVPSFESESYEVYDYSDFGMYLITAYVDSNIEADYTASLTSAGWTVDDSSYEESGYIAVLKNVILMYYYDTDDNGDGYFMVMIMIDDGSEDDTPNEDNPGTDVPVSGAVTLSPSDFTSYGTDMSITVDSISFTFTNIMKGNTNGDCIQIKKLTGVIKNTTPFANGIDTIEIKDKYTGEHAGSVTVYAIADDGTKTAVTGVNDVYQLNGAKYFEIANESGNAFYCSAIVITPVVAE